MPSLYSVLNRDAKNWWYFQELRAQGKAKEARIKERESIRNKLNTLKRLIDEGGLITVGDHGHSIHLAQTTISGYARVTDPFIQAAIKMGVTVIDNTTIAEDDKVRAVLRCPLPAIGRKADPAPYHGMSYAPVSYIVEYRRKLGATIYNG